MSGHSKWSTIKRQKGANDAKRGAAFTKLGSAIAIAVREGGGGDPNFNFKLRLAIDKARGANMPKENITRSIERGLGKGGESILENVLFEGFAPGGVAFLAESVTDNKNRTMGGLRNLVNKSGGTLGGSGSVSYLFKREGEIEIAKANYNLDDVLEKAMESEADDVIEEADAYMVYTHVDKLHSAKEKLVSLGLTVNSAELVYLPNKETMVKVDPSKEEQIVKFLESIEESDDIQNVYSNLG